MQELICRKWYSAPVLKFDYDLFRGLVTQHIANEGLRPLARRWAVDPNLLHRIKAGQVIGATHLTTICAAMGEPLYFGQAPNVAAQQPATGFAEPGTLFQGKPTQLHRKAEPVAGDWTAEIVEDEELPLPTAGSAGAFYLYVPDLSLAEDGLPQGSYALVDPSQDPRLARPVWIRNRDGATVMRRLEARRGKAWVTSAVSPDGNRFRDEIRDGWVDAIAPIVAAFAERPAAGARQRNLLVTAELHPIRTLSADGAPTRTAIAIDADVLQRMQLDSSTLRVAPVTDDAMLPALARGSYVMIDTASARPDEVPVLWAIIEADRLLVRKVSRTAGGSTLVSAYSKDVPDRLLVGGEAELYFCGRVLAAGHIV